MLEEKIHFIKNKSVQAQPFSDNMSQGQWGSYTRGAGEEKWETMQGKRSPLS